MTLSCHLPENFVSIGDILFILAHLQDVEKKKKHFVEMLIHIPITFCGYKGE